MAEQRSFMIADILASDSRRDLCRRTTPKSSLQTPRDASQCGNGENTKSFDRQLVSSTAGSTQNNVNTLRHGDDECECLGTSTKGTGNDVDHKPSPDRLTFVQVKCVESDRAEKLTFPERQKCSNCSGDLLTSGYDSKTTDVTRTVKKQFRADTYDVAALSGAKLVPVSSEMFPLVSTAHLSDVRASFLSAADSLLHRPTPAPLCHQPLHNQMLASDKLTVRCYQQPSYPPSLHLAALHRAIHSAVSFRRDFVCRNTSVPLSAIPFPVTCSPGGGGRTAVGFVEEDYLSRVKCRRNRTVFTDHHLTNLERSFERQKYLSTKDRAQLASRLGLSQIQVKTWYQNRRMKWKKQVLQEGGREPPTKPKGRPRKEEEHVDTSDISKQCDSSD